MTPSEFEREVGRLVPQMRRMATARLSRFGLQESADDCVQKALMEFVTDGYTDLGVPEFSAYLTRKVVFSAARVIRQFYGEQNRADGIRQGAWQSLKQYMAESAIQDRVSTEDTIQDTVAEAVAGLSEQDQRLIAICWIEGNGNDQRRARAAAELGMTPNAVKTRLKFLRTSLQSTLAHTQGGGIPVDNVDSSDNVEEIQSTESLAQRIRDKVRRLREVGG